MKIYAIICTRVKELNNITNAYCKTLSSFGCDVKLMVGQSSIFEAYTKGLSECGASDEDIIIFCHDDIQLLSDKRNFIAALSRCVEKDVGIIGPAGTTHLGEDAIWWLQARWGQGLHRGVVKHLGRSKNVINVTEYGRHGQVVALDGLFLAAQKKVWNQVGLQKPDYFEGLWDFYDIHYTTTSHQLGLKNYTVPIDLIHHSRGELAGRESWHKNRQAFIANTNLPLILK